MDMCREDSEHRQVEIARDGLITLDKYQVDHEDKLKILPAGLIENLVLPGQPLTRGT